MVLDWSIAGTRNAGNFIESGVKILKSGGSAIDAVEKVIQAVESNPIDWSVGYNGLPNLLGIVELDASIMLASSRKAGAVAGIRHHLHPISIARKVMELSPHVLLVGDGADLFANSVGFDEVDNLSDETNRQYYENVISGKDLFEGLQIPQEIHDLAWRYDQYIKNQLENFDYLSWYKKISHKYHGTVNVIAKDEEGEICSGVSTSGLALKFPGRAGDSPIIGSGNYCDIRFGAATCVGNGELAIRLGLARQTVNYLSLNDVETAVKKSIIDLLELHDNGVIQVLAMDKNGYASAASNQKLHFVSANNLNPTPDNIDTFYVEKI